MQRAEVVRDALHAKFIVVGHGGNHAVVAERLRLPRVEDGLLGGDGGHGRHELRSASARVGGRRAQPLQALLAGEHRAFRAAAADEEAGGALGDVLVHELMEHRHVQPPVLRQRGDGGDEKAAHALHLLHYRIALSCRFGMGIRRAQGEFLLTRAAASFRSPARRRRSSQSRAASCP